MLEAIAGSILDAASKSAVAIVTDAVKRENAKLLKAKEHYRPIQGHFVGTTSLVKSALARHLTEVRSWSSVVNLSDLKAQKSVRSIFVNLDTYLMPLSTHTSREERESTEPLLAALTKSTGNAVILGQPGAGKTTSLQKICVDYFNSGRALLNFQFPLLVRLRDISTTTSKHPILDQLQEILGIAVTFPDVRPETTKEGIFESIACSAITNYVDELNALIMLDGFDEIAAEDAQNAAIEDIEALCRKLKKSRLIITSRSREFRFRLAELEKYELAPLTAPQIEEFAFRWLGTDGAAKDFLKKVNSSPFSDNAIRPLTIAHLCAIYERVKNIPDKPKSVYRKIVNLLLEEWDSQRNVSRISRYAGFDSDRKLEFLAHMSFMLTIRGKSIFDSTSLKSVYSKIHAEYDLPANQATKVINEIESHSGLIVEGGYRTFEFAHKSLQEFLAADYLVRLPTAMLASDYVERLPNELAIATALSSKPAAYVTDVALRVAPFALLEKTWYSVFLSRLALEKPVLHANDPLENTLAALTLLTYSHHPEPYMELLHPLISKDTSKLLLKYYQPGGNVDANFMLFRRVRPHPTCRIADTLWVPKSLVH